MVYFDRGCLGFVGTCSSFLLAAEDFRRQEKLGRRSVELPHRTLILQATGGKAKVRVRPLIGHGRAYSDRMRAFIGAGEPTTATRQWPPLRAWAGQTPSPTVPPAARASLQGEPLDKANLRNRLEDAVALRDEVDQAALRVGELDQR